MTNRVLSPELCTQIVQHSKRETCARLCLVSKAFQRPAETLLYNNVPANHPWVLNRFCTTMLSPASARLVPLVRVLSIYFQHTYLDIAPEYWQMVHAALSRVKPYLISLYIDLGPTSATAAILNDDAADGHSHLQTCMLAVPFDADVARFLSAHPHVSEAEVREPSRRVNTYPLPQIVPGSLPDLQSWMGSAIVMFDQFLTWPTPPPLTHVFLHVDQNTIRYDETWRGPRLMELLPRISRVSKTLRSITFHSIPPNANVYVLEMLRKYCPDIRHIGVLSYDVTHINDVLELLLEFSSLRTLHVDFTKWRPQPNSLGAQRALVNQIGIFAPALRGVQITCGNTLCWWARHKSQRRQYQDETKVRSPDPHYKEGNGWEGDLRLDNGVKEGADWVSRTRSGYPQEAVWKYA